MVQGNNPTMDPGASFYHFSSDPERRTSWICTFRINGSKLKLKSQVCCWLFHNGDLWNAKKEPLMSLGVGFAFPINSEQLQHIKELVVGSSFHGHPVDDIFFVLILAHMSTDFHTAYTNLTRKLSSILFCSLA